jgi:nicotinamidase/pyrazinamidase
VGDPDARYDPQVALIVVDLQNDFADPSGSLSVRGGSEIVPVVNAEIDRALRAGAAVAYTQDWHPAHTPHFAQDGGIWPVHCVGETWGAELCPDLAVRGPIVRKGTRGEDGYSGFSMRNPAGGLPIPTELEVTIARGGARRLVVVGLATDYCVKATALDGVRLGYRTAVMLDGVRAVDLEPGDGDRALDELEKAGVVLVGESSPAG